MKIDNYLIIASLNSESACKLINRIPGLRLLISVYQARLQESMLNHSASLAFQQAFSKPCLVNLISKDTHLVFSFFISSSLFLVMGLLRFHFVFSLNLHGGVTNSNGILCLLNYLHAG